MRNRKKDSVEELKYYDESLTYPDGNAVPEGTEEELLEKARTMYHELSKETGEFFDFMMEYCLFDLEGRQGKQQGGYCDFMEEYKAPFIFANFNGTNADVNVLTHEAGHAFEAYTASRNIPVLSQTYSTAEINEIHGIFHTAVDASVLRRKCRKTEKSIPVGFAGSNAIHGMRR